MICFGPNPGFLPASTAPAEQSRPPQQIPAALSGGATPLRPFCEKIPRAWLGPAKDFEAPTIAVCAWCPDKRAAEVLAEALGLQVTHGICRAHADEMKGGK
jgi:hypothetical protein